MSEIIINLRYNRQTGKKDIVIQYESEDDRLRLEHEADHAAVVEKLLGQIPEGERGDVIRERIMPGRDVERPLEAPREEGPQATST